MKIPKSLKEELIDAVNVCKHCGLKYGRINKIHNIIFWEKGVCDLCKNTTSVVNKKYFNYLRK